MMKISKRFSAFACAVILTMMSTVTFFAQSGYVLDDTALLFDASEKSAIEERMQSVAEATGWQIIVHTSSNGISSDEMESYYNDTYYDSHTEYGEDSVMFVIDDLSQNRIILTHGDAMYYFDDDRMTEIKSELKPYLDSYDMYGATMAFLNTTEEFYTDGKSSDGTYNNVTINDNYEKQKNPLLYTLKHYGVIIGLVSVVIGGLSVLFVFARYKYNGKQGTYDLKQNSTINLTNQFDEFVNKRISVSTTSSNSNSSGGSSSGGSSHGSSGSF